MIARRTVLALGLSQLVGWGVTYYLVGVLGPAMAADLAWPPSLVYGGFSAALVAMGLVSPWVGAGLDRWGGRPVMAAGSVLAAVGCAVLAAAASVPAYYAAWVVLGLAMRMTLYDAAFAALARIGGPWARGAISQITLLGGLASTAFWPIGHLLETAFGWRGAALAYAGCALLTLPLHLAIPAGRWAAPAPAARPAAAPVRAGALPAGFLYGLIVTLGAFLNSAMSSLMIGILAGLGVAAGLAVWISTLRGVGQSAARLAEILFGGRMHPLTLAVLAAAILPPAFLAGLLSGSLTTAAIAFALLYGAGNGLLTIVRGTAPLVLFDPGRYGAVAGRLVAPSFLFSAAAPLAYALVLEHWGEAAALHLSAALATVVLAAAILLRARHAPGSR
ncbi:MAG: MFS transporter [Alphaproteobacteria bacterium]|nr:MFS transporter [Alphaproteobacteria bacterium]